MSQVWCGTRCYLARDRGRGAACRRQWGAESRCSGVGGGAAVGPKAHRQALHVLAADKQTALAAKHYSL